MSGTRTKSVIQMAKWTFPKTYSTEDNLTDNEIKELISDSQLLKCLLEMRVDLWQGYDEAYEMFDNLTEPKG